LFLVHHDDAEVLDRREDRRSRPDHHIYLAVQYPVPGGIPLAFGETAVEQRASITETLPYPRHDLRSKAYLRNQIDRSLAALYRPVHEAQVNLGLAASRHTEYE